MFARSWLRWMVWAARRMSSSSELPTDQTSLTPPSSGETSLLIMTTLMIHEKLSAWTNTLGSSSDDNTLISDILKYFSCVSNSFCVKFTSNPHILDLDVWTSWSTFLCLMRDQEWPSSSPTWGRAPSPRRWTWPTWPRWPRDSLALTSLRSVRELASWPSERALTLTSGERRRDRRR